MNTPSHIEIGKRIAHLRSRKGLSQEELASSLAMSRSSLAQMELGKRKLFAVELARVTQFFGLSADAFLFGGIEELLNSLSNASFKTGDKEKRDQLRISSPNFQAYKLRNALLYLAGRTAGKPEIDEHFLHLLLYFVDFDHYECYESQLTGARYIKQVAGPMAAEFPGMIQHLINEKELIRFHTKGADGALIKYVPAIEADLQTFSATEKEVMDMVVNRFINWHLNKLRDYAKGDMPYLASEANELMEYNLAFYREGTYSNRAYQDQL